MQSKLNNVLEKLTAEDLITSLEAARVALKDEVIRDWVGKEMDLSDEQVEVLRDRLEYALS